MNTEIFIGTKVLVELHVKRITESKNGLSYELVTKVGYNEGYSLNSISVPEESIKEVVNDE